MPVLVVCGIPDAAAHDGYLSEAVHGFLCKSFLLFFGQLPLRCLFATFLQGSNVISHIPPNEEFVI